MSSWACAVALSSSLSTSLMFSSERNLAWRDRSSDERRRRGIPETVAVTTGVFRCIRAILEGLDPGASRFTGLCLTAPDEDPASSQSRSEMQPGLHGDVQIPGDKSQVTHPCLRGDLLSGLCSLDVPEEELVS